MKRLYWYDRLIERDGTDLEVNDRVVEATRSLLDTLHKKENECDLINTFCPKTRIHCLPKRAL